MRGKNGDGARRRLIREKTLQAGYRESVFLYHKTREVTFCPAREPKRGREEKRLGGWPAKLFGPRISETAVQLGTQGSWVEGENLQEIFADTGGVESSPRTQTRGKASLSRLGKRWVTISIGADTPSGRAGRGENPHLHLATAVKKKKTKTSQAPGEWAEEAPKKKHPLQEKRGTLRNHLQVREKKKFAFGGYF